MRFEAVISDTSITTGVVGKRTKRGLSEAKKHGDPTCGSAGDVFWNGKLGAVGLPLRKRGGCKHVDGRQQAPVAKSQANRTCPNGFPASFSGSERNLTTRRPYEGPEGAIRARKSAGPLPSGI